MSFKLEICNKENFNIATRYKDLKINIAGNIGTKTINEDGWGELLLSFPSEYDFQMFKEVIDMSWENYQKQVKFKEK